MCDEYYYTTFKLWYPGSCHTLSKEKKYKKTKGWEQCSHLMSYLFCLERSKRFGSAEAALVFLALIRKNIFS